MAESAEPGRAPWRTWEWAALAATTAALLLFAAWPTIRVRALAPPDAEPLGISVAVRDGLFYLSLIRQDAGASPLLRNPFAEPGQDRVFWGVFWWGLAHVRQLTGLSSAAVFHLARYVAGAGCVLAIAAFATRVTRTRGERWLAIQLATWGGGLGWLVLETGWNAQRSADLLTPETSTYYTVLSFPHLAGALALMIGCFAAVLRAVEQHAAKPWGWCAGLMAAALGIFHPFNVLVVLGAWGLYAFVLLARDRGLFTAWVRCGWPLLLGGALTIAYFAGVMLLYPEGLPAETVVRRPAYADLVLGFGLLGLGGAAYAVWQTRIRAWDTASAYTGLWIVATLLLLHSYPLLKQEGRAILGLHVPLAVWTALFFMRVTDRVPGALRGAGGALLVFMVLPTAFAVQRERVQRFQAAPARYYVPRSEVRAAAVLAAQVSPEDRIACGAWNGLVLGAQVPARLFRGKWDEPTAGEHDRVLEELFAADTPRAVRRALVDRHGITVLWVGQLDQNMYPPDGLAAAVRDLATAVIVDEGGVLAVRVNPPRSAP